MSWTVVSGPSTLVRALKCARGVYQRAIVLGHEAMSGSTLKGKAARYGGRYKASRDALIVRMRAAGLLVTERYESHGRGFRRILYIVSDSPLVELAEECVALTNGDVERRVA